jgi:lipooligosaccharide transport system permease protein
MIRQKRDWVMLDIPMFKMSYRVYRIWQRDRDIYLNAWATELWPPFVEPILSIVALGLGLGHYVTDINGMSFIQFIAPAFAATGAMYASAFECSYASFVRMVYQKTFDAILATPCNIEDIIGGEMLWGTTRALFSAAVVVLVISAFGLVQSWWGLAIPLVAILLGLVFSSVSMVVTSLVPSFGGFNYYITLGITPMFFFSGVFFPIDRLPDNIRWLAWFSPLTHGVQPMRALAAGDVHLGIVEDLLWMAVVSLIMINVALALMRRRLIK